MNTIIIVVHLHRNTLIKLEYKLFLSEHYFSQSLFTCKKGDLYLNESIPTKKSFKCL